MFWGTAYVDECCSNQNSGTEAISVSIGGPMDKALARQRQAAEGVIHCLERKLVAVSNRRAGCSDDGRSHRKLCGTRS